MNTVGVNLPSERSQERLPNVSAAQNIRDIATDLTWVDMLKGIAIISVFFGNISGFFLTRGFAATQNSVYSLPILIRTAIGPSVQVFFILSGFGLTLGYLSQSKTGWSWKRWAWRRITKIVFPYYVFVILSFLIGIIGSILYKTIDIQFSWTSLLSYLTFTRNFYPPSWEWNPPLWYMPAIIGLYVIFPILLIMLKKLGPVVMLVVSLLITYTSLIITSALGLKGGHASDLFLSWTFQFTIGMVLAYIRVNNPDKLRLLVGFRAFAIGAAFYLGSWFLRTYIPFGQKVNDSVTSIGIFLILLNLGWSIRKLIPAVNNYLNSVSKQSYYMYLIHFPIISFLIGPVLPIAMHPVTIFIFVGVYIFVMYYVCSFISKPIVDTSSKLMRLVKA